MKIKGNIEEVLKEQYLHFQYKESLYSDTWSPYRKVGGFRGITPERMLEILAEKEAMVLNLAVGAVKGEYTAHIFYIEYEKVEEEVVTEYLGDPLDEIEDNY